MFGNGSNAAGLKVVQGGSSIIERRRLSDSLCACAPRGLATAVSVLSEVASNQSACSASSSWSCCSGVASCLLRVMAFEVRRQPKGGDRCWGQTGFAQKAPYPGEASEAKTLEGGSAKTFAQWQRAAARKRLGEGERGLYFQRLASHRPQAVDLLATLHVANRALSSPARQKKTFWRRKMGSSAGPLGHPSVGHQVVHPQVGHPQIGHPKLGTPQLGNPVFAATSMNH